MGRHNVIIQVAVSNALATALVVLLTASLAGCGLPSLGSGFGGVFGGGTPSDTSQTSEVSADQLLAEAQNAPLESTNMDTGSITPGCPKFVVWPQENNLTVYEPGRDGDGLAIMHRGEITKTKRECNVSNGRVSVRYGFSGRVLLGPRGQSGSVVLPVHVIVSDDGRKQVAQDKLTVSTTVAIENPIAYFSAVKEISFELPEGNRAGDFEVRVGFDRGKNVTDDKAGKRTS